MAQRMRVISSPSISTSGVLTRTRVAGMKALLFSQVFVVGAKLAERRRGRECDKASARMRVFVPREIADAESRVALVPETVGRLVSSGLAVDVESGAGERAYFLDDAYRKAGAHLVTDVRAAYAVADAVLKVREPLPHPTLGTHEADLLGEGSLFISFLSPALNADLIARLASKRVAAFAMELIPRAQKMDALSSRSTVAGYKATLIAANHLGKFFPLLMTAAGTIPPARVFVLGAGVAGLTAIATSRRLGAVVEAFDVRPAARE